ncbi:MAG: hypothetical protein L0Z07_07700 [Planctomycetes bacterium]|nr:hypothetical protein [Planctomycetota bacterium]
MVTHSPKITMLLGVSAGVVLAMPAAGQGTPGMPIGNPGSVVYASPLPVSGTITPMERVFCFDVTKDWVFQTWDRKSIISSNVGLYGVRVPLVTGTGIQDLAGSLTYFFNSNGQIEHISFRGHTGDPAPLMGFLIPSHAFQRQPAPPNVHVYQVKWTSRPQSELRIRPETVVSSTSPHNNYAVELELARPGSQRLLPPREPPPQLVPVAPPPPSATANGEAATGDETKGSDSYFDQVRYATPVERDQIYRTRWPN